MLGIGRRVVGAATLCVAFAVTVTAATPGPALAAAPTTVRVSVASDGTQANGNSFGTDVSGDGRFVVFSSRATNLGGGQYVGVYVHDTVTNSTELVSVNDAGDPNNGIAGSAGDASISRDGRYVAFDSEATNLAQDDGNGRVDVFVHDRQTGSTILVSRAAGGSGAPADANSERPEISADGRHVVFVSAATDISPDATDGHYHVYVADLDSGTVSLVDRASDGTVAAGNSGAATNPAINADGTVIAFDSDAQNLVPGDDGGTPGYYLDVFVRNRTTGTTTLASDPNLGLQALYGYGHPAISGDGSIVGFDAGSLAWELDLSNGTLVQIPSQGNLAAGRISDDGRYYVQLEQRAPSSSYSSFSYDPWVFDRVTGTRVNVGLTTSGTVADAGAYLADGGRPGISDDGGVVVFPSDGTDLVSDDTNGATDVFARSRGDVSGPAVTAVGADPTTVAVGNDVMITATVDDTGHGGSAIASAEMSVDSGPWQPLDASDGAFDSATEQVSGVITAPAELGDHQACVRGTDALTNVGTESCVTFSVTESLPPATIALTEGITVSDAVSVSPSVAISISEGITVDDSVAANPPVAISIDETVTVADDVTATALAPASPDGATTYDGFSTDTVLPGMEVELSGSGFLPGTTADLTLQSDPIDLGTTTAAGDGTFDVTVTIPTDAPLGDHHLVATGTGYDGKQFTVTASVTIVESGGRVHANGSVDPDVRRFTVSIQSHKGKLPGSVVVKIGPHELKADSTEWLADADGTALLHGAARLDHESGYTFTLLLREQTDGPDLFGLLVKDDAGSIVYDIGPAPVSSKKRETQSGTGVAASVAAAGHLTGTYHWTIGASGDPSTQTVAVGAAGTVTWTISVRKSDSSTLGASVDGEVCVENSGDVATQGLAISDSVTEPPSSAALATVDVSVDAKPVLNPGESHCFSYETTIPATSILPGATYKDTAHVTITNHSGSPGTPSGPSPSASTALPATPTPVDASISVSDTNGQSFEFGDSGSESYDQDYACSTAAGVQTVQGSDTATIESTGQDSQGTVTVDCAGARLGLQTYADSDSTPLEGATFELSQPGTVLQTCTSDAGGLCDFPDSLVAGDYTVHESQTPDGYAPAEDVPVTVTSGDYGTDVAVEVVNQSVG